MTLYFKYLALHLKAQMQYKMSFALTVLGQILVSFTTLLGLWFMMTRFHSVAGFTLPQVLLCFAVMLMAFSLAECFGRGFDLFPRMIANGEFDRALVRPRGLVFQVMASQMELTRIGRLVQAVAVLIYALPRAGVLWGPDRVLTLVLMILCGCLLFFCLFVVYAAFSFFTLEGLEFMNIFTDGGREFGRYPFSIYGKEALRLLTWFVPLALVQYYPLLYLLGRETSPFYMLSPLLALLFAGPAWLLWRFGLSRYKSTGS
ncbi:MAG: hypothetical protein GX540_06250 [Clostridiales bacterium]|nr:hypothetical protein [Clostridiales bacterium]